MHAYEENARVPQDIEDVFTDVMAEWIEFRICEGASDEVESQIEVCQREEGEHERDELVDELDVQQCLSPNGVVGCPNLFKVEKRIDSSEESTVEPTSSLRDEFGNRI